ncbi:MAG: hypothetical protein P8N02_18440, partial [Actinomycetota bacterium]|nr:hypothetical protein [Actinomycetota bacterium]
PIAMGIAAFMLVATLGSAASGRYGPAVIALIGTLAATPFTQLRVRVTREQLEIVLGPWGWPRERHEVRDIDWIEADHVDRLEVRLGVGVRGSNRKLTGRAYLLRPGPVIRLQGQMGRRVTITVDGAEGAVSLVEQLLAED